MIITPDYFKNICNRIKQAQESGETDTRLGKVLAKWREFDIPVGRDGKWLLEGFIMTFRKYKEILSAIDPTISADLPPHLLDPAMISHLFNIPPEDFLWFPGHTVARKDERSRRRDAVLPQEVETAEAADILGVSKATAAVAVSYAEAEAYLTLTEAAKLVPGRKPGERMFVGTIWRWCKRGVRNGIRLKSVLIGQQRYTTRAWLQEFMDAVTHAAEPDGRETVHLRTPRQRQTAAERATEELKKMWGQEPKPK